MSDVRLGRADQQRPVRLAANAVHRAGGLRLDRVAKRCPRPVRLKVSHVTGCDAGALQRIGDNPLLGNAVRHRQATRCAVLVDRTAPDHGPDPVTVANRVLEPLDDDDATTLTAHIAVRGRIEGLALAVGRQHLRAGKRDHGRRAQQDVRAACQREVTFPQPQRLARLMDCHQRRTARRVDGDRGTLQPQPIADPSGCCGTRGPDGQVRLDLGVSQLVGCHAQVVVGGQTDEDTGVGVGQSRWRGTRMLHCAPRCLQQEPVLRVHPPGLARRHTEERRIESRHVIDETRTTGHNLAGRTEFWVEEFVDIPTVLRHLRYRIPALAQHVPKLIGVPGARETSRIADYRKARWRLGGAFSSCHVGFLLRQRTWRPLLHARQFWFRHQRSRH